MTKHNGINDLLKIVNIKQVAKYMINGAELVDVQVDVGTQQVIFYFTKEDTNELYTKWLNHTL